MSALALWLKSKLFGSSSSIMLMILIALLVFIIVPNLELIKERLGFETRATLKVKVEAQKEVIDDLMSSNTNLMDTVIINDALTTIKDENVVKQIEVKEKVQEDIKVIVKTKTKKIKHIKKTIPKESQSQAISKVQINTIWDSYCGFNTHSECGVST